MKLKFQHGITQEIFRHYIDPHIFKLYIFGLTYLSIILKTEFKKKNYIYITEFTYKFLSFTMHLNYTLKSKHEAQYMHLAIFVKKAENREIFLYIRSR